MSVASQSGPSLFDRGGLERSILDRFSRQVRLYDQRSAVEAGDRVVDYGNLDAQANRIAHALLAGRQREGPVALLADYGPSLIAGMLGILKSGGAFVPLDRSFPAQRSAAILESAACPVILCDIAHRPLAERLASGRACIVEVDQSGGNPGDPGVPRSADADAYIIYTSGSTGRPKGVVQSDRIVLHNILKYTNKLAADHEDRWSLLFSPCFGEAMNDVFCALLNGGAVCLYDLGTRGPFGLADWLVRERISVFHAVPTVYRRMLARSVPSGGFPHLRAVVLGGEPVYRSDVERHRECIGRNCLLVNSYGSTETKLIRQHVIDGTSPLEDGSVPAGYPVEDTEVVILGADGTPADPGRTGEIAVRSHFLARYQAHTKDSRFSDLADGRRQFRTGDRGRMDPDGRLHHMGRLDDQVKIRGHRVEPAEVEAACLRLEDVREALVTAIGGEPEPTLVAYIVTRGSAAPREASLRKALAKHLPGPMVPTRFIVLDSLPVTLTGKADRLALPAPEEPPRAPFVAPETSTEVLVAQIWKSALDLPAVGVDDDFFAVGGDSLAAISIVVGIEQALGRRSSHSILVEHPTVRELAALLDSQDDEPTWQPITKRLVALTRSGEKTPFFCVHPNSGSVLGFQDLARELSGIRPVYGFQAHALSGDSSHRRIEDIAASYLEDLMAVQPHGPYLLGGRCTGGWVAYEMALQLARCGERVALLVIIDATAPPALRRGGLSGAALSRLRHALHRLSGAPRNPVEPAQDLAAGAGSGDRVKAVFQTLFRAMAPYAAEAYGGRIALVLAHEPTQDGVPPAVNRWRSHARGGLEWIEVRDGTHLTLLEDPHVAEVAERLNPLFDRAETPGDDRPK